MLPVNTLSGVMIVPELLYIFSPATELVSLLLLIRVPPLAPDIVRIAAPLLATRSLFSTASRSPLMRTPILAALIVALATTTLSPAASIPVPVPPGTCTRDIVLLSPDMENPVARPYTVILRNWEFCAKNARPVPGPEEITTLRTLMFDLPLPVRATLASGAIILYPPPSKATPSAPMVSAAPVKPVQSMSAESTVLSVITAPQATAELL